MSSELQAVWSGSLKSKKKSELQQICRQLDIDYKSDSLKADLEQQIRKRLRDNPSFQEDERFMKLDQTNLGASSNASVTASSRRSNRARSASRPREPEDDEQSMMEDDRSRLTRSPNQKTPASPDMSMDSEQTPPQTIHVTLLNPEQDLNQQSQPKSDASLVSQTGQRILDSFNTFVRSATNFSVATVEAIQTTFSSPWKLCVIAILLELIFVIYSTMPIRQGVYVHPKPEGPPVRIPDVMGRLFNQIISKSFLVPFLEYLGFTVIVPFVIAGLMNVPRAPQEGKNATESFQATRDLRPSVFIYCATRLALLVLIHSVFYPNHRFGWANQNLYGHPPRHPSSLDPETPQISQTIVRNIQLTGFDAFQYITTAFAMLIALHQSIRSCP